MFVSEKARRYYVLLLCLFVLLFFVHAKLSVYSGSAAKLSGPGHVVSSDQKIDLNKAGKLLPVLVVFLVVSVRRVPSAPRARLPKQVFRPFLSQEFDPVRFLRPPPVIIPLFA